MPRLPRPQAWGQPGMPSEPRGLAARSQRPLSTAPSGQAGGLCLLEAEAEGCRQCLGCPGRRPGASRACLASPVALGSTYSGPTRPAWWTQPPPQYWPAATGTRLATPGRVGPPLWAVVPPYRGGQAGSRWAAVRYSGGHGGYQVGLVGLCGASSRPREEPGMPMDVPAALRPVAWGCGYGHGCP